MAAKNFLISAALLFAGAVNSAELQYETYVDVGYIGSNRNPQGDEWQGKITTSTMNEVNLHLAMANLWKTADTGSRWGFEFGLQTGDDSKGLVPVPPPPANEPISNADDWRHLYRANVSYLFGEDGELRLTGGLINSFLGYESYLAIHNPNYTRAYSSDAIPFFLTGVEAMWDVSQGVDLGFYVVSGFNYLANPNDVPSLGFSSRFQLTDRMNFRQNIYYGSDQEETAVEYWRLHSNSILEWKGDKWVIAGSFDFGNEKQADLPGEPRSKWANGAIWIDWLISDQWGVALRPEFHRDDDGVLTGNKQTIRGITATLKYDWRPAGNRIVTMLEARYDHSQGDEGGFPDEDGDIKSDQTLLIASVIWSFTN